MFCNILTLGLPTLTWLGLTNIVVFSSLAHFNELIVKNEKLAITYYWKVIAAL